MELIFSDRLVPSYPICQFRLKLDTKTKSNKILMVLKSVSVSYEKYSLIDKVNQRIRNFQFKLKQFSLTN